MWTMKPIKSELGSMQGNGTFRENIRGDSGEVNLRRMMNREDNFLSSGSNTGNCKI